MQSDVKKDILKRLAQTTIKKGIEATPYVLIEMLYGKIFGRKTISEPIKRFEDDDFPLLKKEAIKFNSSGNLLQGYLYHYEKYNHKKMVIFAHGFGNGHHRYLEIINYLAKAGFQVFSYDATSFDESEGEGIKGFPQGVVDVISAIQYIKIIGYKEEDIILIGHSWGAYSIGAAINEFPHISKVVAIAGFNNSIELLIQHGTEWAGDKIKEQIPMMEEYEHKYFGKYADYSVVDGIKKSTTEYFFIHSKDDETVPISIGLDLYIKEAENNPRVKYLIFDDRSHVCYNTNEGNEYFYQLKQDYNKYIKNKDEVSWEDKKHLFDLIVDKDKYLNMLDYSLMDEIIEFIKK